MASPEEHVVAKKQMDAAEAELREYVDRPQDETCGRTTASDGCLLGYTEIEKLGGQVRAFLTTQNYRRVLLSRVCGESCHSARTLYNLLLRPLCQNFQEVNRSSPRARASGGDVPGTAGGGATRHACGESCGQDRPS